jgi:hypothetical protein
MRIVTPRKTRILEEILPIRKQAARERPPRRHDALPHPLARASEHDVNEPDSPDQKDSPT